MKWALAAIAAISISTGAHAHVVTFDFGANNVDLGYSHTYSASGLSIIASGFDQREHRTDLFGKNEGGDEVGLGLKDDPTGDDEIHYHSGFVQLDVADLFGKVTNNSVFFTTGSTTNGEEWAVYGTNTPGEFDEGATLLLKGDNDKPHALPDFHDFRYYDFVEFSHPRGQGDNFLISSVYATTSSGTPEPQAWALMLIGIGGLGIALRGRRGRAPTAPRRARIA
jgi:PEP-CTERM motif